MSKLKVVMTGGGTGGHIYPALAIASGLHEQAEAEILYVGGRDSMEARLAPAAGWPFEAVQTQPLHRKSLAVFKDLAVNKKGRAEAEAILRRYQPDLAIGTGGYASWPVMQAALKLGIPTMIHEQNACPGLSNKMLAKRVDMICVNFDCARELFPAEARAKVQTTGLPVRPSILAATRQQGCEQLQLAPERPVFLVTGGSQGSQAINAAVSEAWPQLLAGGLQVAHLTGANNIQEMEAKAQLLPVAERTQLHLIPYLDHMEYALAAADLVMGRAGASFLAEILCLGIPSLLAPYPYAAGNHQLLNAQAVEKVGGCIIIEDKDLSGRAVADAVLPLFRDQERRLQMAASASGLGQPQALAQIVACALALVNK